MKDKRNKLDIELDILKIIYNGEYMSTNIARHSNLQYLRFKEIISNLVYDGFVKKVKSDLKDKRIKYIYKITSNGIDYLFDKLLIIGPNTQKCSRHEASKMIQKIYCLNCGDRYG